MKSKALNALIQKLQDEIRSLMESARAAHEAATHEENKAEDQYDTRGLEASYLAGAQAKRVAELDKSLSDLRTLIEQKLEPSDTVRVGSLVQLESDGRKSWLLISVGAGGTSVEVDGVNVSVITPRGPLGEALLGREAGDEVEVEAQGKTRSYEILAIE